MPRCYLLAVCQGSSLDQATNNWSLFTLTEQVAFEGIDPSEFDKARIMLPFEMHSYWQFAEGERGIEFEFRYEVRLVNGGLATSKAHSLNGETRRHRVKATGLQIPGVGEGEVRVAWRQTEDGEWRTEPVWWPLDISVGTEEAEPVLPLEDLSQE